MEFKKNDQEALDAKIKEGISRRPRYKNCYLPDLDHTEYAELPSTLIVRKRFDTFNRVYFLSDDAEELTRALKDMGEDDVINIPSKKDLQDDLLDILHQSGYSLFETYERMYNNCVEPRGAFDADLAGPADADGIYQLLYEKFNPFTDTLPTRQEILDLISRKWVLVNRDETNGKVEGALLLRFEPQKCHFYIWVDASNFSKALNLYINGFNYMNEKGYQKAYLWVRSTNIRPKKIYETFGFKCDGLKDYTYTKQHADLQ